MRAIRVHAFGGPEQLRLETVEDPRPAAGQVVVKVAAAGVNPVDTYIRGGGHAVKPALPYTPGGDAAGEVVEIGPGVEKVAVGDRVYVAGSLSGTYAELTLCAESQVHPLPGRCTFAEGAAMLSRRAVGTGVAGGMLAATLLGIFLIPALYVVFQSAREWVRRKTSRESHPS